MLVFLEAFQWYRWCQLELSSMRQSSNWLTGKTESAHWSLVVSTVLGVLAVRLAGVNMHCCTHSCPAGKCPERCPAWRNQSRRLTWCGKCLPSWRPLRCIRLRLPGSQWIAVGLWRSCDHRTQPPREWFQVPGYKLLLLGVWPNKPLETPGSQGT